MERISKDDLPSGNMLKPQLGGQYHVQYIKDVLQVQSIAKWQEHLLVLEKEMATFEITFSSLQKAKKLSEKELGKIEHQVKDHVRELVTMAKEKLQEL